MSRQIVYGVGLGRTGTRSLIEALKILGYDPALHNPGTLEDILQVQAAAEGAVLNHWKALVALRPRARFVLTLHGSVEEWLASSRHAMEKYPLERWRDTEWWPHVIRNRMYRWGTLHYEPHVMRNHYMDHASEVIRTLRPTGRLLILFSSDGWDKLCPFLGVEQPEEPYPHVRDRHSFGGQ